jgi:hypothetical protein
VTTQTKKLIELSDILALHFKCKHNDCKAALTISALHDLRTGTLYSCPVCKESWALVNGSGCELTIKDFLCAFQKLQSTLSDKSGAFPAGFALRLEVKEEPKSPETESK